MPAVMAPAISPNSLSSACFAFSLSMPRVLGPEPLRHRQAGVVALGERRLRRDAEALQHRGDLPRMLRRVPGAPFEQLVERPLAVIGLHGLLEIRTLCPPGLQALL